MASNAKIIGDLIAADASVAIPGDGVILASDLADGSVTTAKLADANVTVDKIATTVPLGTKNLIINGDMRIAQRGTSVTGLSSGSGYQTVDRFQFDTDGTIGTWTMSQDSDVPSGQGFSNSVKYTCTSGATKSADAQLRMNHYIEAQNLQHLKYGTANAESITLSFWVKSNKTGTFAIWTYALDGTRVISNLVTISSADTWEKKIITIAGDTSGTINNDNGAGLLIVFQFVAGTNLTSGTLASSWESLTAANLAAGQTIDLCDTTSNYINITGVQLEVGDTATPFEHRPIDMELARCQRYFCSSFNAGVAPANGIANSVSSTFSAYDNTTGWSSWIPFPVKMRTVPSMTAYRSDVGVTDGQWTTYDSGYTSLTSTTLSSAGTDNGFYCNGSRSSAFAAHDSYLLRGNFTADAEL